MLRYVGENIAEVHPRRDHVGVRTICEASSPEGKEVLSSIQLPEFTPNIGLSQETLHVAATCQYSCSSRHREGLSYAFHLVGHLEPTDYLDSASLLIKVLALVNIKAGTTSDRIAM